MLVPHQREASPLHVGLGDIMRNATCSGCLLADFECFHGLVDQTHLGQDASLVKEPGRWEGAIRDFRGLRHERQRLWQVAQEQL